MLEKGISEGMSGNAIQRVLIEAGMGYTRQDMQADIRRITGRRLYEEPIGRLSPTSFVPVHMVEELPYNMTTNYWYRVKAVYLDPETGAKAERYFIRGSDDWLKPSQAIEELIDNVPIAGYEGAMELQDVSAIGVSHKSGAAYSR